MIISHIRLKNWRNFRIADVPLQGRVFVVGPNASGKSNFLDAIRFLRDLAKPGGGLQKAVEERGGISKIRCLAARAQPEVEVEVHLSETQGGPVLWEYSVGLTQEIRGRRLPRISHERVIADGKVLLNRPNDEDKSDEARLTQTHLEQINANALFRDISRYFQTILYLHLVPQLVRYPKEFSGPGIPGDPFGRSFLERVAQTPDKTRAARLAKIESALRIAVPQLKELRHVTDAAEGGFPHLEAVYQHWRPQGAKQREDQFSDGTLRLIGLLWSLLEGDAPLLLEEPELSLNAAIVRQLPPLMHRILRHKSRQVIITTHSADLLSDLGIGPEEVLLLMPSPEGTHISATSSMEDVTDLVENGLSIADAVLPRTSPKDISQLMLFE